MATLLRMQKIPPTGALVRDASVDLKGMPRAEHSPSPKLAAAYLETTEPVHYDSDIDKKDPKVDDEVLAKNMRQRKFDQMQKRAEQTMNTEAVTEVIQSIVGTEKKIEVKSALNQMKLGKYQQRQSRIRDLIALPDLQINPTEPAEQRLSFVSPTITKSVLSPQPQKCKKWDKSDHFSGGGKIAIQKRQKQYNFLNATLLHSLQTVAASRPKKRRPIKVKRDNSDIDFCIQQSPPPAAIGMSPKASLITLEFSGEAKPKKRKNIIVPARCLMDRKESNTVTVYNSQRELVTPQQ